jgi:hypothetical protein
MARAYGSSAHLLMKRENAYGQAATGNYIRVPFNRCNLGSEQGLIDDPVLGQGRDPLAPLQDVINDEGDIVVPVDPRYLGLWLTGLFGDPDTTDNLDGSWDHEFASGGDDLPSYTVEVGMPKVPAFFIHAGVKLNSIALEFSRSGPAARSAVERSSERSAASSARSQYHCHAHHAPAPARRSALSLAAALDHRRKPARAGEAQDRRARTPDCHSSGHFGHGVAAGAAYTVLFPNNGSSAALYGVLVWPKAICSRCLQPACWRGRTGIPSNAIYS